MVSCDMGTTSRGRLSSPFVADMVHYRLSVFVRDCVFPCLVTFVFEAKTPTETYSSPRLTKKTPSIHICRVGFAVPNLCHAMRVGWSILGRHMRLYSSSFVHRRPHLLRHTYLNASPSQGSGSNAASTLGRPSPRGKLQVVGRGDKCRLVYSG